MTSSLKQIKCLLVGDPTTGKTALVTSHVPDGAEGSDTVVSATSGQGAVQGDHGPYSPTIFGIKHEKAALAGGQMAVLGVWDCASHPDYDNIRPLL